MNIKKIMYLLIASLLIMGLAACNGDEDSEEASGEPDEVDINKTGFPIVDEEIDLNIFANKPAQNEDNDWNDILIWNHYADETNVNADWDLISPDSLDEKRNLAIQAGEDLPDAFFLAGISNSDLLKHGETGSFLALNDLIEEYAPNLNDLMDENPSIRKAITFPDGNIYALPALIEEDFLSLRLSARPWINTDMLAEVDMDVPETTDEFYKFLTAVKESDPDMIPYAGTDIDEMIQWLSGAFGVMNRGAANTNFDLGDDGEVRFYAATDEYKEMLEYVHKLYSEELIHESIFSLEWDQFTGAASEGDYASYTFYDPTDFFGEEVGAPFDSIAALEGPNGDQNYNKVSSSVWDTAAFVLTDENENAEATVRWMDHFYSDEGAELYYMGVEDETYEEKDGELVYMDHIRNPEGEVTFEQMLAKELTWLGSINGIIKEDYFIGGETAPQSVAAAEKIEPFVPEEIWPDFTFTAEENKVLNSIGQDVAKYTEEMRDKFISGDEDLDGWDDYVEELEKIGLDDIIEIQQAAYERFEDN